MENFPVAVPFHLYFSSVGGTWGRGAEVRGEHLQGVWEHSPGCWQEFENYMAQNHWKFHFCKHFNDSDRPIQWSHANT